MTAERTFHARLADHAQRRGDVPALVTDVASVSYAELAARVRGWAIALRGQGVASGAIVGLTVRREIEHLLATLALFELGIPVVALASREPPTARARLARRVGVTLVIGDRDDDAVDDARLLDLARVRAAAGEASSATPHPPAAPAHPALYLTGSGTTGEAKLVGYSQDDLAAHAECHIDFTAERVLRPAHVEYNNSKRMRL